MAVRYTKGPMKQIPQPQWGSLAVSKPAPSPIKAAVASAIRTPPAVAAAPAGALAASGPAVLPPDPAYDQTVAGLMRQRDTRLAALEAQKAQAFLTYGYKQDPVTGAIAFDASNPYSQAAMYKRQFDQSRTGNQNSYAARGQLYAGSLQNAQNDAYFREGQALDSTQKALQASLAANLAARGETLADYELGLGGASGDRLSRVATNPLYEPVTPGAAPAVAAAVRNGGLSPTSINAIAAAIAKQKAPVAKPKPKVRIKTASGGLTMGPKRRR